MGESPTRGKFGGKFWKEGGKEEKGRDRENKEKMEKRSKERMVEMEGKGTCMKMNRGPPFFFFFFFFCLSLLETTEICLGCTKNGNFYGDKKSGNGNFSNLAHL